MFQLNRTTVDKDILSYNIVIIVVIVNNFDYS